MGTSQVVLRFGILIISPWRCWSGIVTAAMNVTNLISSVLDVGAGVGKFHLVHQRVLTA